MTLISQEFDTFIQKKIARNHSWSRRKGPSLSTLSPNSQHRLSA